MAESMSAVLRRVAVPSASGVYAAREADITLTLRELSDVSRGLALGAAATTPANITALTGPMSGPLLETLDSSTVSVDPNGGWRVTIRGKLSDGQTGSWTPGDHLYALLFTTEAPVGGTTPDLVVDLGEILAP